MPLDEGRTQVGAVFLSSGRQHTPKHAIIASMDGQGSKNQLIVRNLEEEVVRELKLRAAQHGRSAEAEHREILRQALLPQKARRSLKDILLAMPAEGTDEDFAREPDHGRDVEL